MKICDSHNDFLTEIKTFNEQMKYAKSLIKDKQIKHIACVIWTTELNMPLEVINNIHNNFAKIKSDKLILCIEDLGFITKNNLSFCINKIIEIKPFSCGIVWNNDNNLGGGAFGRKGLTLLGKLVIKKLEENNILIDTAHMNKKTYWEFSKITTKPIYNSHSNLTSFKKHKRNLNSKQIKNVIESNGFIGLSFVKSFISNNIIDSNKIANQIVYFINTYGENNIGIGSDFYGTNELPIDIKNYSEFKNLECALINKGIKNKTLKKIFYKNFENFINRINDIK